GAPPAEQRSIVFVNGTPTEFGARRVPRLFTKTFDVDGRAISTPTTNRSESSGLSPVTGLTGRALDAARTSKRRAEACQDQPAWRVESGHALIARRGDVVGAQ